MKPKQRQLADSKMKEIKEKLLELDDNLSRESVLTFIEDMILEWNADFTLSQYADCVNYIYVKTRCRLGQLTPLVESKDINEIMLNGIHHCFVERQGRMQQVEQVFDDVEEFDEVIRNIAASVHREINEMNPILDARLADGSRVNAVYKNIVADGPVLTIRKFSAVKITIDEMIRSGTITQEGADFLKKAVRGGLNIFVSGGTSSGKTTFLNALSDYIPTDERVIVIEDSRELQMSNIPNLVQLECHNANSMGKGQISMDMLIKTSLRMRPDRIIVGEVRGKEVADMLQAMNTGHDGSMSTGHGNSTAGMLRRLEAMYLMAAQIPMDAIRAQIIEGIDIMVHLARLPVEGRKAMEISELVDYHDGKYVLNQLYVLDTHNTLRGTGNKLLHGERLQRKENIP